MLNKETGNTSLKLNAKVTDVDQPVTVGTYPDNKIKRSVYLADNTGHIQLVLWRERAENISFQKDDVLMLENVVISTFNNESSLTTTFKTSITVVKDVMTIISTERPNKDPDVISTILAIKEFMCTYGCIGCKNEIVCADSYNNNTTITCPTCSTIFLKQHAKLKNQCTVLLSNKKWFQAYTSVSIITLNTFYP